MTTNSMRAVVLSAVLAALAGSPRLAAADPSTEMFLTRAEYKEFEVNGRKQKRWAPTEEKIGFGWSDQPFAVHVPFDLRTQVVSSRARPNAGEVDNFTLAANKLKLHLKGFAADGVTGIFDASVISAGAYRLDGAPAHQGDPKAKFRFMDRLCADPPNLDMKRAADFKPPVVDISFSATGQTRYAYWVVLDPRARYISDDETRYYGREIFGVSREYWAKHATCKGEFHAAIEGEGGPAARTAKLDIAIVQNNWQVTRTAETLRGDWKQEVETGWHAGDVKTEWKESKLTSVHRLSSPNGSKDVTISIQLPTTFQDCQTGVGSWKITQSNEVRNPPRARYGLSNEQAFGALRVYSYSDDPKADPKPYNAGPKFRQSANADKFLPFDTDQGRELAREFQFAPGRPANRSSELSRGDTILPAAWTADQATREYRIMSLDLVLTTAKPRPNDAPTKHIDFFARRASDLKDNRLGKAGPLRASVVADKDDGYHDWSVRFEELKDRHMGRFKEIVHELGHLNGTRLDKRRQWLQLFKLDQMSFVADDAKSASAIQYTTYARLAQMKQEREKLKAEMNAVKPQQRVLMLEGLRLMKQLTESIEGQMIASRDVYPRPELKVELQEYQDGYARAKLTMYDAAGWYGPNEFAAVAEEYRYRGPDVRAWAEFLKAKVALNRAQYLEEDLAVLYAMPNKPAADNPMQREARQERMKAMTALSEVLRLQPDHPGAREVLGKMELNYLNKISAKLWSEQKLTQSAFKQYLMARGYYPDKPEGMFWQAYEVGHVIWGNSITMIGNSAEWAGTAAGSLIWDDVTVGGSVAIHEKDAARVQADIAQYHVSVNLMKSLVRNGIPMSKIRTISAPELEKFYRMQTSGGRPLDKGKVHRICQDIHETFAYLPDLRALAERDADQLDKFLEQSYFEMLDPSKSWAEAGYDFFFSTGSLVMWNLGGATVSGQRIDALLTKSWPAAKFAEKLAALPGGKALVAQFEADLVLYNQSSKVRKFARGAGSFVAATFLYMSVAHAVSDIPGIRELVDVMAALAPFEGAYEVLAHKGLPIPQVEAAFTKAEAALVEAKTEIAKQGQAIQELERLAASTKGPTGTVKVKAGAKEAQELERIANGLREKPKTAIDANLRASRKVSESIEAGIKAIRNGELDEAVRALKAAREFNRQLEQHLKEFEAKLQEARAFLARAGKPKLTEYPKIEPNVIENTPATPFVPEKGYPLGKHGDFLRLGDLALVHGNLEAAAEFYQAAFKVQRLEGLAAPEKLIESRLQLAEQAIQAAKELSVKRAAARPQASQAIISQERLIQELTSGNLRLERFEGGVNPIYHVVDKAGKKKYLFKTPTEVEINLEALSSAALEAAKANVPKCRAIRSGLTFKHFAKGAERGEVELTGVLTEFLEGHELWTRTEPELIALKKDLAHQRVLRTWLGDMDGHFRNIRVVDGKLSLIDFGFAELSHDPLHPVFAGLHDLQQKGRLRQLNSSTPAAVKLPNPTNQAEFLRSILMYADVVKGTSQDGQLYGWMRRADEFLNYEDMEATVKGLKELCSKNDGAELAKLLRETGVPKAEWKAAFDVLRQRAELLEGVLKSRFPSIKNVPSSPRPFGLPRYPGDDDKKDNRSSRPLRPTGRGPFEVPLTLAA